MSTILDALRKAKQTPPKPSVNARPEILSERAHDYLAAAPDGSAEQVRLLRVLVGAAFVLVAVLGVALVILLGRLPRDGGSNQSARSVATAPVLTPTPPPPPTPQPSPSPTVVTIVVTTPSPAPTPEATPGEATPRADEQPPREIPSSAAQQEAAALLATLRLEGIVYDEDSPMALVGGKMVRQGSRLGKARVVRISRDAVVVEIEGREYTLRQ